MKCPNANENTWVFPKWKSYGPKCKTVQLEGEREETKEGAMVKGTNRKVAWSSGWYRSGQWSGRSVIASQWDCAMSGEGDEVRTRRENR